MKRIWLNLSIARRSLAHFKTRTALAVLGVFLGTFSLVVVSNLSSTMAKKTQLEIAALGENLVIVQSGTVRRFSSRVSLISQANNLTMEDAWAIHHQTRFVEDVSPSGSKTFVVRFGPVALSATLITGVTPNYPQIRNFHVRHGSFFTEADDAAIRKVAVLGHKVAEKLFGSRDPIGESVLIRSIPCRVIGVMEEKGADISGFDQDNQIFVPLNTYLKRFVNQTFLSTVYVRVSDERAISGAIKEIEALLRKRHRIGPGEDDDFTVIDMKDVLSLKSQATDMIRLLGRISATVSFAIGGIGILSIMILMVNERRLEIGIRRAVGSRKRDIVWQFLMESSFISLSGGLVGIVCGFLFSTILFWILRFPFQVSWFGLVFAFVASVAVGVMAGIYPSRRAVAIQPVDVIRSA